MAEMNGFRNSPIGMSIAGMVLLIVACAGFAGAEIPFSKIVIDAEFRSEGVAVADVNRDGKLDIMAGNVWYQAPKWETHPMLGEPKTFPQKGYSDAFLCFAADLTGDGHVDLINVGFPGAKTTWLENPGKADSEWKRHLAVEKTGNESPFWTDVTGDGENELVFFSGSRLAFARPGDEPTKPWPVRLVSGPKDPGAVHGLGVDDINGDGRRDVIIPDGWWENPGGESTGLWPFHAAKLGENSAQMGVCDFDGDGDADVISSSAHAYGIAWSEQTPEGWIFHEIDKSISQTHALHLADINRDGLMDFVTGKRYWAHNGNDPGSAEPSVLCWFELRRKEGRPEWIKREIDGDSGVGLHARVVDINGDGRLDIVSSNKKGVHLFLQEKEK